MRKISPERFDLSKTFRAFCVLKIRCGSGCGLLLRAHDGAYSGENLRLDLIERHRLSIDDGAVAGGADEFDDHVEKNLGVPVLDGGFGEISLQAVCKACVPAVRSIQCGDVTLQKCPAEILRDEFQENLSSES